MSHRPSLVAGMVLAALLAGPALADEEPRDLPHWFLGLQYASGARSSYDVFDYPGQPPGEVKDPGGGGGGQFGYRFGDRFLLALQVVVTAHDVDQDETKLYDGEGLITGTVLFRERSALQPFLRGGAGGTVLVVEEPAVHTLSLGIATTAGCGLQWKLARSLAVEIEAAATFANYTNGQHNPREGDDPDQKWSLKRSNVGYRIGAGLVFWF